MLHEAVGCDWAMRHGMEVRGRRAMQCLWKPEMNSPPLHASSERASCVELHHLFFGSRPMACMQLDGACSGPPTNCNCASATVRRLCVTAS